MKEWMMLDNLRFRIASIALMACLGLADLALADSEEKVWRHVEMVRIWKLAEILNLNESEMAKIIPVIKDFNFEMRKRARERETTLREMRRECTCESPNDQNITASLKKILQLEAEMVTLRQDHYKKMETLLPPGKRAKYMLFEVRFHDEIQDFMKDMSHRRGRRGNPGPAGPEAPEAPKTEN